VRRSFSKKLLEVNWHYITELLTKVFLFLGNFEIVNLLIKEGLDVNASDMDYNTPLHNVVCWVTDEEKEINERIQCIKCLIENEADIDACNIRGETPLHYASRCGSYKLVKELVDHNADLLLVNIDGYNSFEVAIKAEREDVIKYFIDHDQIFHMMRNAQLEKDSMEFIPLSYLPDTPMRKLIVNMPDMALLVLDKLTTNLNGETSGSDIIVYSYEFLDDEYFIYQWNKSKKQN
jgi:ankyrin repeat protein